MYGRMVFTMTDAELRAKLAPIKCFMLDMDGTFYLDDDLIEGSLDFLDKLEATGRKSLFVTNNSSKSADVYVKKLEKMGVREVFRNVLTSGHAAASYCLREFAGKKAFLLGNDMLRKELIGLGMEIDDENPDYVLIAYDTTLDYAKMTAVCDFVRQGLPYIATHPDFNCPTATVKTGFAPDIGAIIAFIEASTGRRPEVILGKPYAGIVEEALKLTGLQKHELAMVGDRLYTDIKTGLNFGMLSIMVLTGEGTLEEVKETGIEPDLIFERLSAMNEYL